MGIFTMYNEKCEKCGAEILIDGGFVVTPHYCVSINTDTSTQTRRRNLSGIYILDRFEDDKKAKPTCFEDCTEETQNKWLKELSPNAVINLAKQLGYTLKRIGNQLDLICK